jgi:hypothetical protein
VGTHAYSRMLTRTHAFSEVAPRRSIGRTARRLPVCLFVCAFVCVCRVASVGGHGSSCATASACLLSLYCSNAAAGEGCLHAYITNKVTRTHAHTHTHARTHAQARDREMSDGASVDHRPSVGLDATPTRGSLVTPDGLTPSSACLRRELGSPPATSAPGPWAHPCRCPGLNSPLPHLRRDWAHPLLHLQPGLGLTPAHICTGTLGTPCKPAPGAGLTPDHICSGTGLTPDHIVAGAGLTPDHICAGTGLTPDHICAGTGLTPDHICAGTGWCAVAH